MEICPTQNIHLLYWLIGLKLFALISAQQYLRDPDFTTALSTKSIHRSNEFEMLVDFFFLFCSSLPGKTFLNTDE